MPILKLESPMRDIGSTLRLYLEINEALTARPTLAKAAKLDFRNIDVTHLPSTADERRQLAAILTVAFLINDR